MLKLVTVIANDSSFKNLKDKVKGIITLAIFYPIITFCERLGKSKK